MTESFVKGNAVNTYQGLRRASGFTVIELMVGMVVGLIATVVMFQVFAVSEGQKRTTTGAGDAQQNGVGSVFLIERDARMAGFAMNYLPAMGCWVNGWNENANQGFTFRMAPFEIGDGGVTPDTLTIAYGDNRNFFSPEKLFQDMPDPSAPFYVANLYGLAPGDVFIIAEAGSPCTLYQISTTSGSQVVSHVPGNFTDNSGLSRTTDFNRSAGVDIMQPIPGPPIAYKKWTQETGRGGRLLNLGQRPTVVRYALQGSQLVAINSMLPGGQPVLISDGIVQFQVQYAYDSDALGTPGYGSVSQTAPIRPVLDPAFGDQWADALPANPTTAMWTGILGIRFAIVSRSMTPEKPDPATGICNATTANPRWLAADVDLDVSADPNWRCYRYRVFEVTVPARNLAWAPDEAA